MSMIEQEFLTNLDLNKWVKANGKHIVIIKTQWHADIMENLVEGARSLLNGVGVITELVNAPGAMELPYFANKTLENQNIDGIIVLGCIIKGETIHNEVIAYSVAQAIQDIVLKTGKPIGFGVLTPNTKEQAIARSQLNSSNKGLEAAAAVLDSIVSFAD